jgi:hypothetical protein
MPAIVESVRASGGRAGSIRHRNLVDPKKPASRPARFQFHHSRRAAIVAAGLAAVFLGGLLLSGYVPFSLSLRPPAASLQIDDGFGATRTGEIMVFSDRADMCRKFLFHNDTGQFGPERTVHCDTGLADGEPAARRFGGNGDRLMSLRDAFMRR